MAAEPAVAEALEPACSVAEAVDRLRQEGYVVLRGVLQPSTCDTLRQHVILTTDEARRQGRNDLFGNIQEAVQRHDLKLDLCVPVVEALNQFSERCGQLLQEAVGGRPRLVELAAITSGKGAVMQPVHADTVHGVTRFLQSDVQVGDGPAPEDDDGEDADDDLAEIVRAVATDTAMIFTALAALQDIDAEMGPTHVWPRTHTVEHHATLWSSAVEGKLSVADADQVFGVQHRQMSLGKGDLVLYDSRVMHCGGANSSDKRRAVLCVSTMGPGIRPDGTTWTMLPSLRNRLMLSDFPLSPEARASAATVNEAGEVVVSLPPPSSATLAAAAARGSEPRPIPPLEEWAAAVQCTRCKRWRPCSVQEAPGYTGADGGYLCELSGFSCSQEQRFSTEDIDAIFA